MSEEKGTGITHEIRTKLGFYDTGLWKRFSARRLELIDDFDLSSRKASEQEFEITQVADILRLEFRFDTSHSSDFEKLVRAAVQSVRRNRKRCTKNTVKRQRIQEPESSVEPVLRVRPPDDTHFLSEISNLNADHQGSVYDMSYSTHRVVSEVDRSRAAIDSIIRPTMAGHKQPFPSKIQLPPLSNLTMGPRNAENEKKLSELKNSLLWLMKKSKSCLSSASSSKNGAMKNIGMAAILAVDALMFEVSFSELAKSSVDYLRDRISGTEFQARFYRSLDPHCPVSNSLEDTTAVTTLQTLVGCCVMDFGFDSVLYLVGEAFYLLILQEYPLISRTSVYFRRSAVDTPRMFPTYPSNSVANSVTNSMSNSVTNSMSNSVTNSMSNSVTSSMSNSMSNSVSNSMSIPVTNQPVSLSNLAAVASELRSHDSTDIQPPFALGRIPQHHIQPETPKSYTPKIPDANKKQVKIRFLSSSLNFEYAPNNTAPPRFVEIVDNAKQAFKLNDNQVYGIRNCKTKALVNTDVDLESIFANEQQIELEVFTRQFLKVPLSEITSVNTTSTQKFDERKPLLPLPMRQTMSAGLLPSVNQSDSRIPQAPLLPRFQPLL